MQGATRVRLKRSRTWIVRYCSQPASMVALGAFRFPHWVARPRGLGNFKMTKKTTVTIDVTFDVAAAVKWICLVLIVLLA